MLTASWCSAELCIQKVGWIDIRAHMKDDTSAMRHSPMLLYDLDVTLVLTMDCSTDLQAGVMCSNAPSD